MSEYSPLIKELFSVISQQTEAQFIIDSSKNLLRAYSLANIFKNNFYLIHLVRDSRAVAWSLQKQFSNNSAGVQQNIKATPIEDSTRNWNRCNFKSLIIKNLVSATRTITVRYEDFVQTPLKSLERLESLIGASFAAVRDNLENNKKFTIGHVMACNRLRVQTDSGFRLRFDDDWKNRLSKKEKEYIWQKTWPLMKLLGYNK